MIALLLNHLWQSSLCLGAAGLMTLALRRNSAHVRFWLWFAASIKFLVPFAALTALGATLLAPMVPPVAAPAIALAAPLAKPFSAPQMAKLTARWREPSVLPARSVPPALTVVLARPATPEQAAPIAQSAPDGTARPSSPLLHVDLQSMLLALWAAGVLIFAIRWLVRWSRVRALLREAVAWNVDAPVAVKFSPSRLEPGLVGILNPIILLPLGIEQQLSPAELKAVLAHELSHWRRHDNLLAAIHMLVEALFWFFPLVWWLGARLNAERERACDEAVLADGNDPQMYAEGILKVCRAYLQSPLACVAGISGAGLKQRIDAIMENRLALRLNAARKLVLSAAAATAFALPLALGMLAAPAVQMQAKAAQILSPIARKIADPMPSAASEAFPSPSLAAIEPIAPLVPQAAAPVANTPAPDPSGGQALTRQNAVQAETPVAPLPDMPFAANNPPTQPLSNTAPPQKVAVNDQPATPNPLPTANTASCAAPKLLNSLAMEATPGGDTMTVATSFDGKPQRLLLGISDTPTQLWQSRAAKLGLPVQMGRRTMDGGGRISEEVSRVQDFALGSMATSNFFIQVVPDPNFENAGSDGVLGTDMMMRYDIDLDFAHRQLNYFTPEQCQGAGVYWAPSHVTSVQMKTYANVVYVPVNLDGHVLVAVLDTSASRTFLNPRTASQLFNVKADGLEAGTVTDGGTLIKAGVHAFSRLSFGGLTLDHPQLAVPFDILSQSYNDPHISRTARNTFYLSEILPDIVIGMDVLKQSHLYISFQNERVYVSPAGDGQPLQQQAPVSASRFNVWRYGYDSFYNFRHPQIKF